MHERLRQVFRKTRMSETTLWQELRVAMRALCRAPSVTIPATVVLALAIGSATALYAVVYAMWLRPLPYVHPERLESVSAYFGGYKLDALISPTTPHGKGLNPLGLWAPTVREAPHWSVRHAKPSRYGKPVSAATCSTSLVLQLPSAEAFVRPMMFSTPPVWSCCLTNSGATGLARTQPR